MKLFIRHIISTHWFFYFTHDHCKTKHKVILSFNIARPSTKPFSALPLQDQTQSHSEIYHCKTKHKAFLCIIPLQDQAQIYSYLWNCKTTRSIILSFTLQEQAQTHSQLCHCKTKHKVIFIFLPLKVIYIPPSRLNSFLFWNNTYMTHGILINAL